MTMLLWVVDALASELLLFAAIGLLIGGIDDLAVDLLFFARHGLRRATVYRRHARGTAAALPVRPGRLAVFIGAWDESNVIGRMLETARARWGEEVDYRIYIGTYPNDPGTLDILHTRFCDDRRIRPVYGTRDGPTTKAEALNRCWDAMRADEASDGIRVRAVVLHDAEDVVHRYELRVFAALIERFHLVQLPVLPLVHRSWVAAHYMDEFAETTWPLTALAPCRPSCGRTRLLSECTPRGLWAGVGKSLTFPTSAEIRGFRPNL